MRRPIDVARSTLLGLFVLALAIVSAGCGPNGVPEYTETTHDHPQYPCGPYWWAEEAFPVRLLQWSPDGSQIVFLYKTKLYAVNVEGTRLQELVDAIPGHRHFFPYGFHFDVSPNGKELVYGSCEFPTTGEERNADRSEVDRSKFNYELAMINLDGTGQKRITVNRHVDQYPVWSPDGTRIAFLANPNGRSFSSGALALYTMAANGSDVRQIVPPDQVAIALRTARVVTRRGKAGVSGD